MAKRSFRGKPKKKKVPSQGDLMGQMQAMQQQMAAQQEAMASEIFEASAGGGAIKVRVTGHQRVAGIEIDPDFVDPEDMEMLQDLLANTLNDALEKSQSEAANRMEGLTGGMGLGDLLGGL